MTGEIRDIGQNVLQSAFVTGGSSSSPVTATGCCLLLVAFIEGTFIGKMMIILWID